MENKINLAIQILPLRGKKDAITIIDRAIECIARSGLKHRVTPFETVVEGNYDMVLDLVKEVQKVCYENGAEELLANIKIHSKYNRDVFIGEKMDKYDPGH